MRGQSGFTVMELVIALAILGLSMVVLLETISHGLDLSRRARAEAVAAVHARSLLDEQGVVAPLAIGKTEGDFGDGFHWVMRVEPYHGIASQQLRAAKVSVTIKWEANGRALELSTLRLRADGSSK
jgi:general secretion pathway protein I